MRYERRTTSRVLGSAVGLGRAKPARHGQVRVGFIGCPGLGVIQVRWSGLWHDSWLGRLDCAYEILKLFSIFRFNSISNSNEFYMNFKPKKHNKSK
jgi:hypothetical protein